MSAPEKPIDFAAEGLCLASLSIPTAESGFRTSRLTNTMRFHYDRAHVAPTRYFPKGVRGNRSDNDTRRRRPCATRANPYLGKPGEPPATARAATCALSGGFIHLYAALDNGLFDKYGVKVEFVSIRGSVVSLAALAADEIQFLYCAADATIPGVAAGGDAKLIGAPLVGLPGSCSPAKISNGRKI